MFPTVDDLLERALAAGADAAEVYAERGGSRRIKVYEQAVEQLTAAHKKGVGLRVVKDGAPGYAYSSEIDDAALDELVTARSRPRRRHRSRRARRPASAGRRVSRPVGLRRAADAVGRRREDRARDRRRARGARRRRAREARRGHRLRRRRHRGLPRELDRRARQLPREPLLHLRLRARRARRPGRDGPLVLGRARARRPRPAGVRVGGGRARLPSARRDASAPR